MSKQLQNITRLYFDTNIFIYFLEEDAKYADTVEEIIKSCAELDIALFTSEITITECLIAPHKREHTALIEKYETFFLNTSDEISILPVDSAMLLETPNIAAQNGLKLVDAIHMSTAQYFGCDGFLTNDKSFRSSKDVKVLQLSEFQH